MRPQERTTECSIRGFRAVCGQVLQQVVRARNKVQKSLLFDAGSAFTML